MQKDAKLTQYLHLRVPFVMSRTDSQKGLILSYLSLPDFNFLQMNTCYIIQ